MNTVKSTLEDKRVWWHVTSFISWQGDVTSLGPLLCLLGQKIDPFKSNLYAYKTFKTVPRIIFYFRLRLSVFRRIIPTFSKSLPRCALKKKKNGVHKLLWLLSEKWRNSFNRWVVKTNLSRIMLQTFSKDMVCISVAFTAPWDQLTEVRILKVMRPLSNEKVAQHDVRLV